MPEPTALSRLDLTAAQRGIWYAQNLSPDNPMFQIAQFVELRGTLDSSALASAVRRAVEETDALNMNFADDSEGPYQFYSPSKAELTVTDLTGHGEEEAELLARALMDQDLSTARGMGAEDLLRIELIRITENRYFFYQRAHHVILDGYSAVMVLNRIAELYSTLLNESDPAPLGAPSLKELLADDAAYAGSDAAAADQRYWAEQLADVDPAPGLTGTPEATASALVRASATLPAALSDGLTGSAASTPALLITAVAAYLHKMTGERQVSIALPVTARRGHTAKSVPSMLSNVVPVRLTIAPETSVADSVAAAGIALRNSLIHQRHRLENSGAQSTYLGPSVNILPVLEDLSFGAVPGEMNILSTGPIDDLSIVFHGVGSRHGKPVTVQLEGNAELYDHATLEAHLQRFLRVAEELASAAHQSEGDIASLTVTSPSEATSLVELGAADPVQLPQHTVVEEFERIASATPLATAVVAPDGRLTFGELDRRANQLAAYLRHHGAQPGQSVAVRLERGTLLAIAIVAVLKSGAAYVPLDPDYPTGRLEGMLEDAAPLLVLSSSAYAEQADPESSRSAGALDTHIPVIVLDSELVEQTLNSKPSEGSHLRSAGPDDLAYVIFTSGSTGRPKGVGVEHLPLLNLLISHTDDVFRPAEERLGRKLKVAHTAGLSFDASWDPILWMFAGHELHFIDNLTRRDPEALTRYFIDHAIDSVETTPSFAKALIAEGLLESPPNVLALGGEAVDGELWDALASAEGIHAYNFYGPTETTVDSMTALIEHSRGPSLGTSVANSSHYILDSSLSPVPAGAIGELYIAGLNLARGYLDRPGLSSERFIADPFGESGARMYRTGDIVRRSSHGEVEFLGRADEQVKIRGFRIELQEIEAVLRSVPSVNGSAVIAAKNQAGLDQLIGYVTGHTELDTTAVREALRDTLPDYMVPSVLVQVGAIPLTPNGKLDQKSLPEPVQTSVGASPRTEGERAVADVFADVLGLDSVGIDSNFFELGGHSLLATRLAAQLRDQIGVAPTLREIFENPTVAGISELMVSAPRGGAALVPQDRPHTIPLSYAQQRLWFLNQFDTASGAYNIPVILRLDGRLDVAALEAAIDDVVDRHESLRTIFPWNEEPSQLVLTGQDAKVSFTAVQISAEQLQPVLTAESGRGFDVTRELPVRATLLQVGGQNHVLLMTLHHIAADGWSLAPLARDLSTAYNSRLRGSAPTYPALPVQYADYALWQRSLLGSEDDEDSAMARQLRFWSTELADSPAELALPHDHPRGTLPSGQSTGSVRIVLSAGTHERLKQLAAARNASMFMVMQAAFATLLTKLGAGTDIPLGTPVAGRSDSALDELVGFFVNTLVLRTDTSGNPTAADLVDRVRHTNLRAYANQDAPFERVVEKLNPARSEERHPLFQVMLTLQNSAPGSLDLDGLTAEADEAAEAGGSKFDLLLDLMERSDGIAGSLGYNPALFTEETAQQIAARFVHVVEQFAAAPEEYLDQISVLTADERVAVAQRSSGPTAASGPGTVIEAFSATAAASPTSPAVSDSTRTLTFADLQNRAQSLAAGLTRAGVRKGDRVAVALPRTVDVPTAALAVLSIGAVYVPIDLGYPAGRISLILKDSAPRIVITDPGAADDDVLRADTGERLTIDKLLADDEPSATAPGPDDPAYLIYTSGSTGTPKGVAVPHSALANLFHHHQLTIFADTFANRADGEQVTVAHIAGLGFDAAWDPVLWLIAGGHLLLVPDDIRTDAEALARYCDDHQVDVLETTPSYVRQLLGSGLSLASRLHPMVLVLGGEQVPDDLWQDLATNPQVAAYNFYGPTEFAVDSVTTRVHGPTRTIGRPIHNTTGYVLDHRLAVVPDGVIGELYLAGPGSATGYHNRPQETAATFLADPHTDGGRMYRTGDLVRRLSDGTLQFVSRVDDQVKIRGFRIEPAEIEAVLLAQDGVQQVAVMADAAKARIAAYFVGDIDADELRSRAALLLPDYMVPQALVQLDTMPLTPHGKLDQRALPEPTTVGGSGRRPETADENTVCRVFGAVLGADAVSLDDDFFALGGHSLLAVDLIAQLREAFSINLPLRALFEAPTPAALLRRLAGSPATADSSPAASNIELVPLAAWMRTPASARPDRLPLSWAQQRMWFLNQLDPGASDYNISLAVRLTGELNIDALSGALDDLMARHESLRTIYPQDGGSPEQRILPVGEADGVLRRVGADSDSELQRLTATEAALGFDVTRELPLRATLIATGASEWVLHLVIHHIASDGASLAPLARDLSTAYSARCCGASPLQQVLPAQYADFALWQRHLLDGVMNDGDAERTASPGGVPEAGEPGNEQPTLLQRKIDQWRDTLSGIPDELRLPADTPRQAVARHRGAQHSFLLPDTTTARLGALARSRSASLFMALHASLGGYLGRIGAGEDLVIGSPTAGRKDPALAQLIGFFVNTVPIRLSTAANPSFSDLLDRARDSVLDAFDKDEVPFERLVEVVNPTRQLGRHPLFQVMLTVENTPQAVMELPGVTVQPEPEISTGEAKFDLSFTFRETADGSLAATLDYNSDMFTAETIAALVDRFVAFTTRSLDRPDVPMAGLQLMDSAEEQQLLAATSSARDDDQNTADPSILAAFSATAARQPSDTALVVGPEKLTFSELDQASSLLASRLAEAGVTPGDTVSAYLPRSVATVTALLGILKAGAVYNPIDIEYPLDRVTAILEDARPSAILTAADSPDNLMESLTRAGIDARQVRRVEDLIRPGTIQTAPAPQSDALAYVMFTSGSTGRPKGVEVSHGSLANLLSSHRQTLLPTSSDREQHGRVRVAHTTGVGFDASWDPILWMIDGHELHLVSDDLRRDPQALAEYFSANRIGAWETTPSYLRELMKDPVFADLLDGAGREGCPAALRLALGGEAFDSDLWNTLSSMPSVRAWNLYGPTEATVDTLMTEVSAHASPVLGSPVANSHVYVLDDHLQHVAPGAAGELYLAGSTLARGYRGRPDLTAERFVADPFGSPGELMYRTGDIVTRHRDGRLVFGGRNDDQIKIRGFRVEPGEIERVVRSVDGVADAVVRLAPATDTAAARLIAYVVRAEDADDDVLLADAVRTRTRADLPGYMVPAAVVVLGSIPLTVNGKLDVAALPEATENARTTGTPPRTPRENAVAQIFAEVLSLPSVGVDESFFDLGGHSFLAQQLISKVNDALGAELPVQSLFRSPSVGQLLREASKGADENVADSLRRVLPLRASGDKAPLFAIHPATGVAWGYAALLRNLDRDRPLIGLQMPGMVPGDADGVQATTLTELADDYIDQLKSVQPVGPYHLIGWSFGGNLVQRIASRLQELGDEVAFLAILDAYPTRQDTNADIGSGADLWVNYLHAVGYPVPAGEETTLNGARILEILTEYRNPLGNISLASLEAMVSNFSVLARLIREAPVERYRGQLLFFTATLDVPYGRDDAQSWAPFIDGEIIDTQVNERHSQMLSDAALLDISPVLAIHLAGDNE